MEDFIVISDDSDSESSGGTRSGRARRLRRALSRTPGALPRRTVVSERAAARRAPCGRSPPPLAQPSAQPAAFRGSAARLRAPHGCSRFPPSRRVPPRGARRAPGRNAGPPGLRALARERLRLESGRRAHGRGPGAPGAGPLEPQPAALLRPGRGLPRALGGGRGHTGSAGEARTSGRACGSAYLLGLWCVQMCARR